MNVETPNCKHVFIDIVGYSKKRTVEAQVDIISALNKIVLDSLVMCKISRRKLILLPTGDGMCISIINNKIYDIHITLAISIIDMLSRYNIDQSDDMRKFKIRIGINENIDNIVIDICNRRNIAGAGINYAQRLMSLADESMIMIGVTVFEQINKRDKYLGMLKEWSSEIKHGERINAYQYIDNKKNENINVDTPSYFKTDDLRKELFVTDQLEFYIALCIRASEILKISFSEPIDKYYNFISLYYISHSLCDYYSNTRSLDKGYTSNTLAAIEENGKIINLSKGLKEVREIITSGSIAIDLWYFLYGKLIDHNNAETLFSDKNNCFLLVENWQQNIKDMNSISDKLKFIKEVK